MKIITVNTNGIRAAARKNFFSWLSEQAADVICIQETKAQQHQLTDPIFYPAGYHCYYFDAEKKGYSGTALYSLLQPKNIIKGFGDEQAYKEGRYLQADFAGGSVISLYLPSGSSDELRQGYKLAFMNNFLKHLRKLRKKHKPIVICGDWNIAHRAIDLKNWKTNQKNSGFLPEERQWLDTVFDEVGFIDAFREVNQAPEEYTWWSNRGRAWEKNVGWRLDYQIVTPSLQKNIKNASIYRKTRFSDHAPLIIEYDYNL